MTRVRIGSATWDIGPAQETPLLRSRPPLVALWVRTGAVLTLTGTLALTGIVSTPKAEQAREETVTEASAPKDAAQIAAWVPPQPRPEAKAEPVDPLAPASVFAAELSPVAGRFGPAAEPPAETTRFAPWTAFTAAPEWREEEFGDVQVVDGRTLQAGSWRIQLIGLDLPMAQQICRTLDGRFESCATRAATQLELLTRHRRVVCHYRAERGSDAIGRCRIGTSDLTDRMVQTGYVWRSASLPLENAR